MECSGRKIRAIAKGAGVNDGDIAAADVCVGMLQLGGVAQVAFVQLYRYAVVIRSELQTNLLS